MKKILGLIVFSIALSAITQSCSEKKANQEEMKTEETQCKATDKCCNATEEQMAGIRKAIDLYVEAAVKGDSKIAEAAFAKTATMSYSDNDTLVSVPIKVLLTTTTTIARRKRLMKSLRAVLRRTRLSFASSRSLVRPSSPICFLWSRTAMTGKSSVRFIT